MVEARKRKKFFGALLFLLWAGVGYGSEKKTDVNAPVCEVESVFGISLPCIIYRPEGTIKGGVLFVHMLGRKKEDFVPLAGDLKEKGYCSMIFDLPGHPVPLPDEEDKPDWREFGPSHFKKMMFDIQRAWKKMIEECGIENEKKVATGAELGANLLMEAYLKGKIHPDGLVLLSPALSIKGLDTYLSVKKKWQQLKIPTFIITDTLHTYFLYSARKFKEVMGDEAKLREVRMYGLGTYLLRGDLPIIKEIMEFIESL